MSPAPKGAASGAGTKVGCPCPRARHCTQLSTLLLPPLPLRLLPVAVGSELSQAENSQPLSVLVPTPIQAESAFHHLLITRLPTVGLHSLAPCTQGRQADRQADRRTGSALGKFPTPWKDAGSLEVTPPPSSYLAKADSRVPHLLSRQRGPLAGLFTRKEMGWRAEEF